MSTKYAANLLAAGPSRRFRKLALYEIEDARTAAAFRARLSDDVSEEACYIANYLAKGGDADALAILNRNYRCYPVSSLQWSHTVRLFGKHRYRPAAGTSSTPLTRQSSTSPPPRTKASAKYCPANIRRMKQSPMQGPVSRVLPGEPAMGLANPPLVATQPDVWEHGAAAASCGSLTGAAEPATSSMGAALPRPGAGPGRNP